MMWYLYGRSSDAEQLEMQQISILPAAALIMQNAPCKRLFPRFLTTRHTAANVGDVEELGLVELLEAGEDYTPLEDA
ncbi:hypothetical protein C6341_g23285 [Phytophthora cactorum]|nr:hypothetical protein C6341_g23285 [Phytophthora cactorum]